MGSHMQNIETQALGILQQGSFARSYTRSRDKNPWRVPNSFGDDKRKPFTVFVDEVTF
jgi:hypothetical protein